MRSVWKSTTMVLAVATAIGAGTIGGAGQASAKDSDYRLPPVTILIGTKAQPIATPSATTHLLTLRDRYALNDTKTKQLVWLKGPLALALQGSRLRNLKPSDGLARLGDRTSVLAVDMDAALDVADGVSLHAFSTMMRAKRRVALLSGNTRGQGSMMTSVGIGAERAAGGTVALEYASNTVRGRRDALSRMTEQAGGGLPSGNGTRLSFSNATPTDQRGRLTWTVSAAAMRRPMADGDFAAGNRMLADNRAEIAFRVAL